MRESESGGGDRPLTAQALSAVPVDRAPERSGRVEGSGRVPERSAGVPRRPAELEAEVEWHRRELLATLDRLADRVNPRSAVRRRIDQVRGRFGAARAGDPAGVGRGAVVVGAAAALVVVLVVVARRRSR